MPAEHLEPFGRSMALAARAADLRGVLRFLDERFGVADEAAPSHLDDYYAHA